MMCAGGSEVVPFRNHGAVRHVAVRCRQRGFVIIMGKNSVGRRRKKIIDNFFGSDDGAAVLFGVRRGCVAFSSATLTKVVKNGRKSAIRISFLVENMIIPECVSGSELFQWQSEP